MRESKRLMTPRPIWRVVVGLRDENGNAIGMGSRHDDICAAAGLKGAQLDFASKEDAKAKRAEVEKALQCAAPAGVTWTVNVLDAGTTTVPD